MTDFMVFPAGAFSATSGSLTEGERWLGRSSPWLREHLGTPGHVLAGCSDGPPHAVYLRRIKDLCVVASTSRRSVEGRQQAVLAAALLPSDRVWTHLVPVVAALQSATPEGLGADGQISTCEEEGRNTQRLALDLLLGWASIQPLVPGAIAVPGRDATVPELLAIAALHVGVLDPSGSCVVLGGSEALKPAFPRSKWSIILSPSMSVFDRLQVRPSIIGAVGGEVRGIEVQKLRTLKLDRFDRLFGRWEARSGAAEWVFRLDLPLEDLNPVSMTDEEWQRRMAMLEAGQRANPVIDAAMRLNTGRMLDRLFELCFVAERVGCGDEVAAQYLELLDSA